MSPEPVVEIARPGAFDAGQAFAAGNYAGVAMAGDPDDWRTHASLGLVGKPVEALAGLAQFSGEEPEFYAAVAHWIHGNDQRAAAALAPLAHAGHEHARNLLALIEKPRIEVLGQLPWSRRAPHDLLAAASDDPKFVIRNVSFHTADEPNEPYLDVWKTVDRDAPPDFYLCNMVEWHHVPPNIQELPCPILGHTADYDMHLHAVHPWLELFDELIVTDHTEWADVHALVTAPVSTFPKCFGLAEDLPAIPNGERPFDFFMSGTLLADYHPDKARVLHEILSVPDFDIRYIRGFLDNAVYRTWLGTSKASFSFVRHPGALPTRGIETLSMGCALVLQEESVLRLFVGPEHGTVAYGPRTGTIGHAIDQLRGNWNDALAGAQSGAQIVREHFAMPRVASQYLRYATFLAARPRRARQHVPTDKLLQKRTVVRTGWQPDDPSDRRRVMQANIARCRSILGRSVSAEMLNEMAREFLLEHSYYESANSEAEPEPEFFARACELFEMAVRNFPKALAPRFNFIRALIHHGSEAQKDAAIELAIATLAADPDAWDLTTHDDILPYDFFGGWFHYRSYMDHMVEELKSARDLTADRIRLIRASLSYYIGKEQRSIPMLAEAVRLDPEFSRYRLALARALLTRNQDEDRQAAREHFAHLAKGTPVFPDAVRELERITADESVRSEAFLALRRPLTTLHRGELVVRPDITVRVERSGAVPHKGQQTAGTKSLSDGTDLLVAALIPDPGEHSDLARLVENLMTQTVAHRTEVLVAHRAGTELPLALLQRAPNLTAVPIPAEADTVVALNHCLAVANAPFLTICAPGDVRQINTLEILVEQLQRDRQAVGAYADHTVAPCHRDAHTDELASGTIYFPGFDRRRLFAGPCLSPHLVWRRTIHDQYGRFDPSYGHAAEYELFLRVATRETFCHIEDCISGAWWSPRIRHDADVLDIDRARQAHWPAAWGDLPTAIAPSECFKPTTTMTPSIELEARSHLDLQILRSQELPAILGFAAMYRSALRHGDTLSAELALRSLLESHPTLVSAHQLLASLTAHREGARAANDILQNALALSPSRTAMQLRLGANLEAAGQPDAAATHLQAVGDDPRASLSRGSLALQRGNSGEAMEHFERTVARTPDLLDAWIGLAIAALHEGDSDRLARATNRARALAAWHPTVRELSQALMPARQPT